MKKKVIAPMQLDKLDRLEINLDSPRVSVRQLLSPMAKVSSSPRAKLFENLQNRSQTYGQPHKSSISNRTGKSDLEFIAELSARSKYVPPEQEPVMADADFGLAARASATFRQLSASPAPESSLSDLPIVVVKTQQEKDAEFTIETRDIFLILDQNHDDFVTKFEILDYFGNRIPSAKLVEIFDVIDLHQRGMIDLEEFRAFYKGVLRFV